MTAWRALMADQVRWRHRWGRKIPWLLLKILVILIYLFIFAPIVVTWAVSFNEANRSRFPPVGFTLGWWQEAVSTEWLDPMLFSLRLAILTAIFASVLGTPLAFAFVRHRFFGREALLTLSLGPLFLPALVTSIGLLQFLHYAGLGDYLGFWALMVGHLVIAVPFTVRTIAISLQTMPPNLELAAASLGARPWRVLIEVVFPIVKTGIIAGATFAFIHSFVDINISLFITIPGEQPVTIKLLNAIVYGFPPTLAAVSIISLLVPLALVIVIERVAGLRDFIYVKANHG